MMVSKIAVIALVAIVACPILLGYGMNISEVTETTYKDSGVKATDVTGLLLNGHTEPSYSYTHSDTLQLNSSFYAYGETHTYPYYESIGSQASSLMMNRTSISNVTYNNQNVNVSGTYYKYYFIQFNSPSVGISFYGNYGSGPEEYLGYAGSVWSVLIEHNDNSNRTITIYHTSSGYSGASSAATNVTRMVLNGGPVSGFIEYCYQADSGYSNHYVDIAAGFHFQQTTRNSGLWPTINLPTFTKQYTMSINLDSITDSNYTFHLNLTPFGVMYEDGHGSPRYAAMEIKKTTADGVTKWTLRNETDSSAEITELYIDPSVSNNTYQFTFVADQLFDEESGDYYPLIHITANYIGEWPTLIGIAEPYLTYNLDYVLRDNPALISDTALSQDGLSFYRIAFYADSGFSSPIIRVDDALIRAFQYYQTITDRTYDPGSFRENPSTTITNIQIYGTSITFAGITYVIDKYGNITLGNHQVSLNNVTFNSVPNNLGTYDNRIDELIVSTTSQPSTISFNGTWSAKVMTGSLESSTYTYTEWTPGQFAWDGMDQNFLIVGLITCLGVFVALGIYARKRGTGGLIPLMIVVGGAAMVFFVML